MEKAIAQSIWGRAVAQGWLNEKGKLNAKGKAGALEHVIGMAAALEMVDHPAKSWMLNQAWLSSVRGAEERFPKPEGM